MFCFFFFFWWLIFLKFFFFNLELELRVSHHIRLERYNAPSCWFEKKKLTKFNPKHVDAQHFCDSNVGNSCIAHQKYYIQQVSSFPKLEILNQTPYCTCFKTSIKINTKSFSGQTIPRERDKFISTKWNPSFLVGPQYTKQSANIYALWNKTFSIRLCSTNTNPIFIPFQIRPFFHRKGKV